MFEVVEKIFIINRTLDLILISDLLLYVCFAFDAYIYIHAAL